MARLSAVLFDFGDTLLFSPDGAQVLVEEGVEAALAERLWHEIWAASKTPAELAKRRDLSPRLHREAWLGMFSRADAHVPGVSERLYQRVMTPAGWEPYPDTAATLRGLHDLAVAVGVISNVVSDLRPVFEAHGLDRYVASYTHSFEHGLEKPEAGLFLAACESLGKRPGETLMVGDSHLADGGAVEAGLPTLLLPPVPRGAERGLELVLRLFA